MLNEITKLHININKIEDTRILCNNTAIAIRSDRGLHILDIPYNLQRYDKKLDYVETIITAPKYSPVSILFENSFIKRGVRNSEFIQMILDPTLWPHNKQLLDEMTSIAAFEWSPSGFIGGMQSAMAVLTNVGCVELFILSRLEWISIINISSLVKDNVKRLSLAEVDIIPKNSKQLQDAAHALATVAICWPNKVNKDDSCYFVTAQKNGLILFWLLHCHSLKVKAEVIGYIDKDPIEILNITWVPVSVDKFLLIKSNILGKVYIYVCIIESDSIKALDVLEIWTYNDRMTARHFNYIVDDENIILLYSKNRHFVVQLFDKNLNLKTQEVKNLTDYKITDIKKLHNAFYLSTINNKMYKIKIKCSDKLNVETTLMEVKESYPSCELHAIGFSPNGVLCTFALIERKVLWRKEPFKIVLIFLKKSNDNSEILALLNNENKTLTHHWDYIEVLRYLSIKTGMLPELDYDKLLSEGETDIYKLKVYYILLILYNNLEKLCKNSEASSLPETSLETISEKIHALYACNIMEKIYLKHKSNCDLSKLELETLFGAKAYLEYYCTKYEKDLSILLDPQILPIVPNYKYLCQCCDEKINGFSCTNGHLNMFCSLTFTPIESDDYLVCKACGALAHLELMSENPTCVFCDLYLHEFVTT